MSKQHGMLFADRLMPPLLDGRKTQTRRPVKCNIDFIGGGGCNGPERDDPTAWGWENEYGEWFTLVDTDWSTSCCPYRVGDLIWARECWGMYGRDRGMGPEGGVHYRADLAHRIWTDFPDPIKRFEEFDVEWILGRVNKWRPSIHMPKWACRCWLKITDVRVQRIQEISDADCFAEGIESYVAQPLESRPDGTARGTFRHSWNSIYPGTWEENIWVWSLTFERTEAPCN